MHVLYQIKRFYIWIFIKTVILEDHLKVGKNSRVFQTTWDDFTENVTVKSKM